MIGACHGSHMSSRDQAIQLLSRYSLLGACITAGTACLAGCTSGSVEAETTGTEQYEETEAPEIEIQVIKGDIEIRDEQRETVHLKAIKKVASEDELDLVTLQAEQSEDRLSLTVDTEDSGFLPLNSPPLQMDLTRTVPEGLDLIAEATNGDVEIETTGAESVSADTTNGDIMLSLSEPSEVRADTTNGDVSITLPATAEPAVSFETTNGDVAIKRFEPDSTESDSAIDRMIHSRGTLSEQHQLSSGSFFDNSQRCVISDSALPARASLFRSGCDPVGNSTTGHASTFSARTTRQRRLTSLSATLRLSSLVIAPGSNGIRVPFTDTRSAASITFLDTNVERRQAQS